MLRKGVMCMANFENLKMGAKNVFDKAVAKTGDAVNVSKGYALKTQISSKLNDLYRQLGKAQFEHQTGEADNSEEIGKLFSQIAQARNELSEAEKNFEDMTGIKCKSCGHKNSSKATFCSNCGSPL